MARKTQQWWLSVAFLVLGVMLVLQFRVHQGSPGVSALRSAELTVMLRNAEQERDQLRVELADVRNRLAQALESGKATSAMHEELDRARILAGLVPVSGPGITLVLDDSKVPRQKGEDPNLFLLHDDDILKVVNELHAAGAEAIAINGERLTALSEIRCAGPTISINNTRVAPPLQIVALGDSATLENALRMRGGVLETLTYWGIEVKLKREATVVIPAYRGGLVFRYAHPVPAEVRK